MSPNFNPDPAHRLAEVHDTTYIDTTVEFAVTYYYGIASVDYSGNESLPVFVNGFLLTVERVNAGVPVNFELSANFPNPFNPSTTIRFALPARSKVRTEIFNLLGQRVAEYVNEELDAG